MKIRLLPIGLMLVSTLSAASVTVTPTNESVQVGLSRPYTAMVSGLANAGVVWSVNGVIGGGPITGTVSPGGLFTAPMMIPMPATVTLTATSVMDSTVLGSSLVTVKPAGPALTSLAPASVTVGAYTILVNGTGFQAGAVSTLNGLVLTTVFISPTQLKVSGTATSAGSFSLFVGNPGSMFSPPLILTVTAAQSSSLSVSPSTSAVPQGNTLQFAATYNGGPASVAWAVSGVAGGNATVGTISAAGLYTAPALIPSPPTVSVSAAGPNSSTATAFVAVVSNQPATISAVTPAPLPLGIFTVNVSGSGYVNGSIVQLGGAALSTQYVSPTQLSATGVVTQGGPVTLTVANGPIVSAGFVVQAGVANPLVSSAAARRFLEQAAFGPTAADASHVQQVGFAGYLSEQFAMPVVSNYNGLAGSVRMPNRFLTNAVMNSDQLRQRVAFALSQIFVTSLNKIIWATDMAPFQQMLMADAFTNYKQLLTDVTLSPAMGNFLDMANNGKANAAGTLLPNENYAREVLQLFSIGTDGLNLDGSLTGVPNYNQKTITEFARVFTGWTYAPTVPGGNVIWGAYINGALPMVPYAPQHDTGPKTLLNGQMLPGGQSAQKDMADAIDNIFNHPNVAPFFCKQLIQHLVKSNPSPGYVQRVALVFNNPQNRGDMPAVIAAILTDVEARASDVAGFEQLADGHLQEPVLFLAGYLRGLNAQVNDQNYFNSDLAALGQDIYNAPSVFNYFSPNYQIPGTGLTGGEFQLHTPFTAIYRSNQVAGLFAAYQNPIQTYGPGTTMDLTPYANLANSPSSLVDALDLALMHGQMPASMKQILVTAVTNEAGGSVRRVQTAIYLILSSGYYNVWH